jgi:hypothetical protein
MQIQVKQKIAVRGKDTEFIEVMAAAARACQMYEAEITEGRMLLGIAAAGIVGHLSELREITEKARASLDHNALRRLLAENISLRSLRVRYDHVVAAVAASMPAGTTQNVEIVAHRVLSCLHVWHVDAGPDGRDTRLALDLLSDLLSKGEPRLVAADVFAHLCDLAAEYGPRSGEVDADTLRRNLRSRFGISLRSGLDKTAATLTRCCAP